MQDEPANHQPGDPGPTPALHAASDSLRSEKRYRQLVDGLRIGVLVTDRSGAVLLANPAAERLIGYTGKSPSGDTTPGPRRTWFDEHGIVVPVENYPGVRAQRERAAVRDAVMGLAVEGTDGITWFIIDSEPEFGPAGEVESVTSCFTDVTAHVNGEAERQALAHAVSEARRLESIGVLAGGVAHDFNNLLTGILANAEFTLSELPLEATARDSMREIIASASRAATLARRMLAYSGRAAVALTSLDLNAALDDLVGLMRPGVPEHVTLDVRLASALPAVLADPAQLGDLFSNLLTNAIDAIGGDAGTVTVTSGTTDATAAFIASTYLSPPLEPGPYAYFDVTDTGEGIPDAVRARLFEPFFTTRFTGRGLGLAAAVGLVRSGHGAVHVQSEAGNGAAFRVLLPLAPSAPAAAPPAAALAAPTADDIVLIADDEETVLRVAGRALARAGYQTLLATDGRQAVDLFGEHRQAIRAVVLDVTMPGLDGREALGLIRLIAGDVPAVLMSGYSIADLGFDEPNINAVFLQKPFSIAELNSAVRDAIEASFSRT